MKSDDKESFPVIDIFEKSFMGFSSKIIFLNPIFITRELTVIQLFRVDVDYSYENSWSMSIYKCIPI